MVLWEILIMWVIMIISNKQTDILKMKIKSK